MMRVEKPLHWRQGLFLQPHHFQALERSFGSYFAPYLDFGQPHFWGVAFLDVNLAALESGKFEVRACSLMFPDGTYVVTPDNGVIETRDFNAAWKNGEKPLIVYIALKSWNSNGKNAVVVEEPGNMTQARERFVAPAESETTNDLHTGGPAGNVEKLLYNLKIFFDTERDGLGDYQLVPVARLEKMADKTHFSDVYIPPCLTIGSSTPLQNTVKEIHDQIGARGNQLEKMKRQRGIQTAEFGSRDMVYLLALRSLNRYIPILHHFIETNQVHPWVAYGLLRQLIGELSAFSENVDVMGVIEKEKIKLPAYNHENLGDCFTMARTIVTRLLDEITAGPEYVIRLVFDGTYFAADLKPAVFDGKNLVFLAIKTDEDHKKVIETILATAKLSSRENLPILIARALPGVGLQHLPIPPQELPRRAKTTYFSVDHHSELWSKVKKGNNAALYWDNAPKDIVAELMIVSR